MKGIDQRVDLFERVVESEGSASGRGNAVAIHQRLGAVVSGPDGDAFLIDDRADVMGMDSFEDERDKGRLLRRRSNQSKSIEFDQPPGGMIQKFSLVGGDSVQADLFDIVDGVAQAHGPGDVGRSFFDLIGERIVFSLLESHVANHLASALVRRHRIEEFLATVKNADPHGTVDLVAREGVEVAIEFPNVDLQMRNRLSAVDEHGDIASMGLVDDRFDGIDRSECILDMGDGNEARARPQQGAVGLHIDLAFVGDRNNA